ncbi:hypothetical protein ACPCF3_01540 [Enterococcus mundtii]
MITITMELIDGKAVITNSDKVKRIDDHDELLKFLEEQVDSLRAYLGVEEVNSQQPRLDERQKKIIPKFAHEFIQEGIDSGSDYFTIIICADSFANAKPQEKFSKWLRGNSDLFIQALLNGYEVGGTVEEVAEG